MANVSGGKTSCCSRNCNFSKPCEGWVSMLMRAWLCRVTESSSCCMRGGMSVKAIFAKSKCLRWYSRAACRFKASTRADSCNTLVLPTLLMSRPSVFLPTANSECSLMPCSGVVALLPFSLTKTILYIDLYTLMTYNIAR